MGLQRVVRMGWVGFGRPLRDLGAGGYAIGTGIGEPFFLQGGEGVRECTSGSLSDWRYQHLANVYLGHGTGANARCQMGRGPHGIRARRGALHVLSQCFPGRYRRVRMSQQSLVGDAERYGECGNYSGGAYRYTRVMA